MDKREALKSRKASLATEDVQIGEVTVTVRAVSREEVDQCKKDSKAADDKANFLFEQMLISRGLVDPEMSLEDVQEWLTDAPAGDSVTLMDAIARLSGMDEGAPKSRVSATRKRSKR